MTSSFCENKPWWSRSSLLLNSGNPINISNNDKDKIKDIKTSCDNSLFSALGSNMLHALFQLVGKKQYIFHSLEVNWCLIENLIDNCAKDGGEELLTKMH